MSFTIPNTDQQEGNAVLLKMCLSMKHCALQESHTLCLCRLIYHRYVSTSVLWKHKVFQGFCVTKPLWVLFRASAPVLRLHISLVHKSQKKRFYWMLLLCQNKRCSTFISAGVWTKKNQGEKRTFLMRVMQGYDSLRVGICYNFQRNVSHYKQRKHVAKY